jgi:hypothetical protein
VWTNVEIMGVVEKVDGVVVETGIVDAILYV